MLAEDPGRPDAVKLLDFGVASGPVPEAEGESRFFSGTLAYIAPEQTRNQETPAADVYSLGMIAYELLTGARPFKDCRSHELLEAILRRSPAPVRTVVPGLSIRLADLVMAMLEKNPADRPSLERIAAVLREEEVGFTSSPGA
jgi:serine/threonine-protein kinase